MSTDTRDRRATAAVACPRCGAGTGKCCIVATKNNPRPVTHSERREAYRLWRDKQHPKWNEEHGVKPPKEAE